MRPWEHALRATSDSIWASQAYFLGKAGARLAQATAEYYHARQPPDIPRV